MRRRPGRPRGVVRAGVALVALVVAGPLLGPGVGAQERDSERSRLEAEVRERFAERVRKRLGLSAEQERALAATVESFQAERRALWRRKGELRRQVRALDLTGGTRAADVDPGQARAILDEMVAVETEELRLFRAEQEALLRQLTPSQVLQLHELRDEMGDAIRRIRRNRSGRDRDGGGSPAPNR